jgi:hypothetical protein
VPANLYETLNNQFPFISVVLYGAFRDEFVGIIQNSDHNITSMYDFGMLTDDAEKSKFLALGEKWYYESNHQVPINIYLKEEWKIFNKIFKTFITKELTVMHGPSVSLASLSNKKKRRSIIVVKKL